MISATKRIGKDIRSFREGDYEKQGIYCHFNDDNIYYALQPHSPNYSWNSIHIQ